MINIGSVLLFLELAQAGVRGGEVDKGKEVLDAIGHRGYYQTNTYKIMAYDADSKQRTLNKLCVIYYGLNKVVVGVVTAGSARLRFDRKSGELLLTAREMTYLSDDEMYNLFDRTIVLNSKEGFKIRLDSSPK